MKDRFVHSLRIQLTPDSLLNERISALVEHCKQYGFNDVMLMINAEEFNYGHITIDEAKPWVEKLKKAKESLLEAGISVSVNNWIEIGHLARGRTLKAGQNFTTMTDRYGTESALVACPLDTEWQKYFCEYASFLVRELEPDYFWIEDDFRYHNHAPLDYGGCFCRLHLGQFNKALGTSYTREEFVKRAFENGKPNRERKVWLDCERKSMVELAEKITDAVKSASPKTELALMSSDPANHCTEARDWQGILGTLARGGEQINRIHLPAYNETSGKEYIYFFNGCSMAVRHFSGDKTKIWPEVENGNPSVFRKSPRFLRFHIEGSMPLILDGMTYSLYGFCGNGVLDGLGYAKEVKRLNPYLSAVRKQNIRFSSLSGVTVPIFEDICYKTDVSNGFSDIKPKFFNAAAYLSSLGISYAYSSEHRYKGKTLVLFSDSIYCFTDGELIDLFRNNSVILDGFVASELYRRGLGELIGATDVCELETETPAYAYETLAEEREILGIKGYRSSTRTDMGRLFSISYSADASVKLLSHIRSSYGEITANGFAEGKNFLVVPYMVEDKHVNQFCELRRTLIRDFVLKHTEAVICSELEGIYPYLYADDERAHIMLTNALLDCFEEITLNIKGLKFDKVSEIKHDGRIVRVEFKRDDERLIIKAPLPQLSCVCFILE